MAPAIQYGHMRTAMSAGHAARGRDGIHELLDIETARATADTLTTLNDDLTHGVGISGPDARRAVHAAAQAPTFAGSIRTRRQARDILGNPALTVYDNPRSFLMCVYNRDRALCHRPDVTDAPRLDRCQPSCANVARTDHHADQLLQHAQVLEKQAASEALPRPLADRLARRADQLRELVAAGRVHDHSHAGEADQGADDIEAVGAAAVGDHAPGDRPGREDAAVRGEYPPEVVVALEGRDDTVGNADPAGGRSGRDQVGRGCRSPWRSSSIKRRGS